MDDKLTVCLALAGLSIAVVHLLRWPWGELHRVAAYCLGTAVIWGGVFLYLGPSPLFWQLSLFPATVGGVVLVLKALGQVQHWYVLVAQPWIGRQLAKLFLWFADQLAHANSDDDERS